MLQAYPAAARLAPPPPGLLHRRLASVDVRLVPPQTGRRQTLAHSAHDVASDTRWQPRRPATTTTYVSPTPPLRNGVPTRAGIGRLRSVRQTSTLGIGLPEHMP